ncbi:DNA methyltransferase [Mesorhizobium retamae]|uniref:site-specific DNA-methyltransferase (adenine-specific) n=1 Tax=Mesorhizobium retamae TaxID=2912854 RepID=A0ABS9QNK9_9HYPH|nr:DNA methyltransferase [Mesorhizobium sp. IRAMC:0171]MCG7509030.1 class I SAM-dependent DNA methyltransferase [Mesorhizobium sp. IRAMC:0171]
MSQIVDDLKAFRDYAATLDGDEKGEAQVFCDRLFIAFGHKGYKEAGASLEYRIKKQSAKGTSFADLIWKPRLLLEMKKRGAKLELHYQQAFDYWLNAVPNRPRYVILCNFDEFWIYDFDKQLFEPVDRVSTADLHSRYTAMNFLLPVEKAPIFNNDREDVSRQAATETAELFRLLTRRPGDPVPRVEAQRYLLQLVVSMFAEDIDMIPAGTITSLVRDCLDKGLSSYDLIGGLFRQMNDPIPAKGGRYVGVPYFNGGLFAEILPIELTKFELELIGGEGGIASKNWSRVNPAIFGTLFQQSMDTAERHKHGRHFTSEADIQRVVGPTIVRPWQKRIDAAKTMQELLALRKELSAFRVLDPACGSGNFLYVAFREMARLDIRIMLRLKDMVSAVEFEKQSTLLNSINPRQFFGIDNDSFGVELAKVTLMLAKKLALNEAIDALSEGKGEFTKGTLEFSFHGDDALPLDNLDENILLGDAMFDTWPEADAIVGNPPYQSKNKLQEEVGALYLHNLRERHPEVDGRSDFCVYWYRLAHDNLKHGHRAGLVGTNTIRQNYSRVSGLDYIVENKGTITEAVSSMIWPGSAVVHVSIVNWIKGEESGLKRLYLQEGNRIDEGWRHADLDRIPSSLSFSQDVTKAAAIEANAAGHCYQGQTPGHKAFLVEANAARELLKQKPEYGKVLKPYLIGDDLVGEINSKPTRYIIDFNGLSILKAKSYPDLFQRVENHVLPDREEAVEDEEKRNALVLKAKPKAKVNHHHANFLKYWWRMSYARDAMMRAVAARKRYIVCVRVTKRPIFDFVSSAISPSDALTVFAYDDDYTFGILQSDLHWSWFVERCSTMKADPRYTSNTVFDSFPWPQAPTKAAVKDVAQSAVALRELRRELMEEHRLTLRELYRSLELPGAHPLKDATAALDAAVRKAYGMGKKVNPLQFLLKLNEELVDLEAAGHPIVGPGLPAGFNAGAYRTSDCISP